MEQQIRAAHALAKELADGINTNDAANWQVVYSYIFSAMMRDLSTGSQPKADEE